MKISWLRRVGVVGVVGLLAGLVGSALVSVPAAFAAVCPAWVDSETATECVVSSPHAPGAGPWSFPLTLHVTGSGHIDGTGTGITLNITGGLVMDPGAVIEADDLAGNDTGTPVVINVSGDVLMKTGSRISSDDNVQGGHAGNITITAANMTMCGPGVGNPPYVPQPGCDDGSPGALVSACGPFGNGTQTGESLITITIGDLSKVTGSFYMEGGSTGYMTETGARVTTTASGLAGDIAITAGGSYFTEPGAVIEAGDGNGNAVNLGGQIYLVAGCNLTSEGRVTSKGNDPGADLVHLEGCVVVIRGLVESTGKGHSVVAGNALPNSCDAVDDGLLNNGVDNEKIRDGKPANSTACVEVWGNSVTIDSTNGWAGELNADIGNGGSAGTSWIDVFALCCELSLKDGAGNDRVSDNGGGAYNTTFLIHANSAPINANSNATDQTPNTVTVKAKKSTLTGSGSILQAFTIHNGGWGGSIFAEASGNVVFDPGTLVASGDFLGGPPCPSGSGACGKGGDIHVQSWSAAVNWLSGQGDVRPNASGTIALTACTTVNTGTTTFNGEAPVISQGVTCDASKPELPVFVPFQTLVDRWAKCGESSISGKKLIDDDGDLNTTNDQTPGVGWHIHVVGPQGPGSVDHDLTTIAGGIYSIGGLPPGTYTICETLQPGFGQIFPTVGTACAGPPPTIGYTVELGSNGCCLGTTITGKDFINTPLRQPPLECEKLPVQTVLDPVSGNWPGNLGPDYVVRLDLGGKVQDAVNAAALADDPIAKTGDINDDGVIIILVLKDGTGQLGGDSTQNVVISADYSVHTGNTGSEPKKFALIGCSVTLHDATPGDANGTIKVASTANAATTTINGRLTNIFMMDVHGSDSPVAGIEVAGNYRYMRNQYAHSNTGVGFKITGNWNTVHNGAAGDKGKGNTGDGVYVGGNYNLLTDTNAMANGGNGFNVVGNYNSLLKLDSGDRGKGNGNDGLHVAGYANVLQENDAIANAWDGIDVSGGTTSPLANKLKKNASNKGSALSDQENSQFEYRLAGFVKNDGGGNSADTITVPKTSATTKCTTFPATNATSNAVITCE